MREVAILGGKMWDAALKQVARRETVSSRLLPLLEQDCRRCWGRLTWLMWLVGASILRVLIAVMKASG